MTDALHGLSEHDLRQLADALRSGRLSGPYSAVALQRVLPVRAAALVATELQSAQGLGEAQLAVALDLVAQDRPRRHVAEDVIDLVTTGPDDPGVAIRDTSVVVRELFTHAQRSVLVVGYASHRHLLRRLSRALRSDRSRSLASRCCRLICRQYVRSGGICRAAQSFGGRGMGFCLLALLFADRAQEIERVSTATPLLDGRGGC